MIKLLQTIDDRIKEHQINVKLYKDKLTSSTSEIIKNKCRKEIGNSEAVIKELNFLIDSL